MSAVAEHSLHPQTLQKKLFFSSPPPSHLQSYRSTLPPPVAKQPRGETEKGGGRRRRDFGVGVGGWGKSRLKETHVFASLVIPGKSFKSCRCFFLEQKHANTQTAGAFKQDFASFALLLVHKFIFRPFHTRLQAYINTVPPTVVVVAAAAAGVCPPPAPGGD